MPRKRIGILALLLGIALAAAGVSAADRDDPTDTASDPGSDAGIDPPGKIEFVGENLFSTANGTFHRWRIVESQFDPAAPQEGFAIVEVDLSSVDTGIERRDDHLRNPDFFEIDVHPIAMVRVHSFRADGQTAEGRPRFRARFDIDLHGVEKTLEGEVVQTASAPPAFAGSLVLDRTDFGVGGEPSRWNPMSVSAEIPIRFEVEL